MIDFEPFPYRFLFIIITLYQGLAGHIILLIDPGRIEYQMINAPRGRMYAPAGEAPDNLFVGYINFNDELDKHFGSDASLDAKTEAPLREFLALHAGRRAAPAGPAPRITQTRWFLKEHRNEIPAGKNPADCIACHKRAGDGYYDH